METLTWADLGHLIKTMTEEERNRKMAFVTESDTFTKILLEHTKIPTYVNTEEPQMATQKQLDEMGLSDEEKESWELSHPNGVLFLFPS